jgi:nucleoside-diphosphate-sugar epimerase
MKSKSLAALQGKRVLLTGASGALGMELQQIFAGTTSQLLSTARDRTGAEHLDVLDGEQVRRCFAEFKPDVVIHLAAIVPIPQIEKDHGRAFMVNVVGLDNVLKEFESLGRQGRVVVVSSSEVYGNGTAGRKFVESDRFSPNNFYAYTKVAQEELAGLYVKRGVDIKIARVFNYSSTYKKPVYSLESFANQIASIVKGGGKREIVVGNLDPERDFIQGTTRPKALAIANDATQTVAFNVSRRNGVDAKVAGNNDPGVRRGCGDRRRPGEIPCDRQSLRVRR